jgi:hypothetical protein
MDCVLTLMGVYFLYRRFILRDFCSKWKVALSLSPALFFLNGQRRNNHTPIHVNTKVFPNIAEITYNCPFRVPRWCKGTVTLGGKSWIDWLHISLTFLLSSSAYAYKLCRSSVGTNALSSLPWHLDS